MSITRILLALSALVLFTGCAPRVVVTPLNPRPPSGPSHAYRSPASVQIFTSSKPTREYVEVAMIQASQTSFNSANREKDAMDALRKKAAQEGCDALILGQSSEDSGLAYNPWVGVTNQDKTTYRATCIVYTIAN